MGSSKTNKGDWASDDDAGDLVTGVLSETEEEAAREQERVEREIEEERREQRRRRRQERKRRRAEAEARISAEAERLDELERRRTERQHQSRVEQERDEREDASRDVQRAHRHGARGEQAPRAAVPEQRIARTPQPSEESGAAAADSRVVQRGDIRTAAWVLAALLVVGGGLVAALFAVKSSQYAGDSSTYTKVVYSPKEPDPLLVEKRFTPVEAAETEEPEDSTRRTPPQTDNDNASPSGTDNDDKNDNDNTNDNANSRDGEGDGLKINLNPEKIYESGT